jgi:MFS family permease
MNSHKKDPDNAEETCSNNTVERQTDVESICTQDINTKKEPYTVFSTQQQIILVIITAFTAMISPLTANIYLPALNQIEESLQINTEQVNLTVTVYMIFQALSPTFWGTLADSLGRRPILMYTMVVYCGACVGLALTPNYAALIVFRMLQAFGSSPVIAVGAGIIGDIADSRK